MSQLYLVCCNFWLNYENLIAVCKDIFVKLNITNQLNKTLKTERMQEEIFTLKRQKPKYDTFCESNSKWYRQWHNVNDINLREMLWCKDFTQPCSWEEIMQKNVFEYESLLKSVPNFTPPATGTRIIVIYLHLNRLVFTC